MRLWNKTQDSCGKNVSTFQCWKVPVGGEFDVAGSLEALSLSEKAFSLAPPTQILSQSPLSSRKGQLKEQEKKGGGREKVRDSFLPMASVIDQRDCFLILILDTEYLFLNLKQ